MTTEISTSATVTPTAIPKSTDSIQWESYYLVYTGNRF